MMPSTTIRRSILALLLVLTLGFTCSAADLNGILDQHTPTDEAGTKETTAVTEADKPADTGTTGEKSLFDILIEKLQQVLNRLERIIKAITNAGRSLTDNTTPPAGNTTTTTPATPPATTSTPPRTPAPAAGASRGQALLGYLQQAGLTGEKLRMAWSIAMAESGGDPRAFNGDARTGDKSYGLFQINMIGRLGPARRREFGISSDDQLFDPMTNIRAMLKVSSNCTNWRPWSVYKNGSYRSYYDQYPPR